MSGRTDNSSLEHSAKASRLGRLLESWSSGILIVVLLLLWQTGVRYFEVPNFLLPAPTEIAQLFVDEW